MFDGALAPMPSLIPRGETTGIGPLPLEDPVLCCGLGPCLAEDDPFFFSDDDAVEARAERESVCLAWRALAPLRSVPLWTRSFLFASSIEFL